MRLEDKSRKQDIVWEQKREWWDDWNGCDRRKSVLYRLDGLALSEVGFVSTGIAGTGGSCFCIDFNDLHCRKPVMYRLECLGPEEVGFESTGIAGTRGSSFVSTRMTCIVGSRFCIDWNGWDRRKSVLYRLECLALSEVGFVSNAMAGTGGSGFCID